MSSGAPTGRAPWTSTGANSSRLRAWCGSRGTKHGRRRSPSSAPTTAPTGISPRSRTPCGRTRPARCSPSGSHLVNLRRPGGLSKDTARAEQRAQQLTAIDPDWDCAWPLDWQRHYAILRDLAADEPDGHLPDIRPGVTVEGEDVGRWLQRQQLDWRLLNTEQQQRLTKFGIRPAERPTTSPKASAAGTGALPAAFQRGITALAQYIAREGTHTVPRQHTEPIALNGQNEPVPVKLGVWISNTKSRRSKLNDAQRAALAELGGEWA
ncbi:helicase associated domain-containing protein [Streptomyces sp. NPDC002187]|uniref:helicase associated domain-containing protein n=1 Tax=Streptomyces sp. NPDC002187 TaxID=3364637 RepID=UPI0036A36D5E